MKSIISLLILLLAVLVAVGLYSTRPKTRKAIPARPVPLVQTSEVSPVREAVFIEAFGTVIPARSISLQAEVEGRIIDQNPALGPGGFIAQGDIIVQIDPADYELRVRESRAEMEEAKYELNLEEGKQVIAQREWKLMEGEVENSSEGKSLALREPHLRLVRAKVEKAKSRLEAAELALQRTTVRAPFNALVLEEFTDTGQLVSRQSPLATLAGTDQFWVQVSIPVALLQRLSLPPGPGQQGSSARVIFEPASGTPVIRQGHVTRILGELDPEGRMARILIVLDDPMELRADARTRAVDRSILLGSYVKVMIDAGFFDDVYVIPREALREGEVIWVQDSQGRLRIRDVQVVWRRTDEVLARAGLEDGDRLILSRLQSPLPGLTVKSMEKSTDGVE